MPLSIAGPVFIEFALGCAAAPTKEALSALLIKTVGRLGFDQVNVSIMRDCSLPSEELMFGLANTYPEDWQQYYADKACMRFDPVAQNARGNGNPFFWSDLHTTMNLTSLQTGFLGLAGEAGLNNGIGLPFPGAHALHGGIALATSNPADEHLRDLNILWAISNLFYKRLREILAPAKSLLNERVEMTVRETDILILSAKGLSDRRIANQIGRSENTVNTHMRRIYHKLGAHTRLQAFSNAVKQQLIDLP
ncbi:helix-turn-helix transcriptional regulator [Asticcacaulis sp.]|uniref:helix-turn-helix transcriptional regulator n=1 Tax=Asticcacaulis sp. TaxID=1872648 RepID=UPI002D180963|nr:autoinducer binding domain-containing protein [Asticcacaulis sp.]HTM82207.1 autoinducer binding domain-containing protein [Asticcacaulis sp.]